MIKKLFFSVFVLFFSAFIGNAQPNYVTKLSDNWAFKATNSTVWKSAQVPGTVHMDLFRNNEISEPYYRLNERHIQWVDKCDWEYKTVFKVSREQLDAAKIFLRFNGLDTYADVFLNGNLILSADNMFRTWNVPVKEFLKDGENELRILFVSSVKVGLKKWKAYDINLPAGNDQAVNGGLNPDECVSPFVRKAPYHFGWDWGPRFVTSGIFRPIELITQNDARIDDVYYRQDNVNKNIAEITALFTIDAVKSETVNLLVTDANGNRYINKNISLKKGINEIELPLSIRKPRLWWCNGLGKQELYNMTASLRKGNSLISSKSETIGIRSIKLVQSADSIGTACYFEINGVPVFMKGANHIPNDLFVDRMTKDVYDNEIANAKNANMNMLRIWGGGIYEDDYFYKRCDEEGILIWQDFMFACSMYPDDNAFYESVKQEAIDNVKRLRNRACLALWCGNNEIDLAWQQYKERGGWGWKKKMSQEQRDKTWKAYVTIFKTILPEVVSKYDGRAYRHSSPITNTPNTHSGVAVQNDGDMHYWGVWQEGEPFEKYNEVLGRFMSEYGFQSLPSMNSIQKYVLPEDYSIDSEVMKSHQRAPIGNAAILEYMNMYYNVPKNFEDFIYLQQMLQAEAMSIAIRAHRQNMPHTMGSLYWQINDCWPVASWSSTDYYREWKASHYFIKKAFEPVIIAAKKHNDNLLVSVVNDGLNEIKKVNFTLQVITADGKVISKKTIKNGNISANSSSVIFDIAFNSLFNSPNQFAVIKAEKGTKLIARHIYYPSKIKDMALLGVKPTIKVYLKKKTDNVFIIDIRSKQLVKNMFLSVPFKGFFSDNYMDVLPRERVRIEFMAEENVLLHDFKSKLKYNCVQNVK